MSGKVTIDRRESLALLAGGASALLAPGVSAAASRPDFAALETSLGDKLATKDGVNYTNTRAAMTWNKRLSDARAPDGIVRAASVDDVQAAIRYARQRGLRVTLRGSGHNYHAAALRDGGLLIDVSHMNAIDIDAGKRRASVQPGVKGGALASALEHVGLAFPVGHCSDVALSGFLLNGGLGWNTNEWGPACMSIRGMEMVTASGVRVYADHNENADLFWAARGSGPGFFAAVTRYDLDLFPMPQAIRLASLTFDFASFDEVAGWLSEAMRGVDPLAEVICTLGQAEESTPQNIKLSINVTAIAFAASQDQARARYASLLERPKGKVVGDIVDGPSTMSGLFQGIDTEFPGNKRMVGDMCWTNAVMGELMMAVKSLVPLAPPPPSPGICLISQGSGGRPRGDGAAYSMGGGLQVGGYAFYDDAAQDEAYVDWVRAVGRAVQPYTFGHYVGEADLSVVPERAQQCFSPAAWQRLQALKRQYDPTNVFFSYLTSA